MPGAAGVDSNQRPQPLAGPDAAAIEALAAKFLPEYVWASDPGSLSCLLAPGAFVLPLGGALSLASISEVRQLGSDEGPRRSVLVAARLSDPGSGAVYPVAYRLEVRRAAPTDAGTSSRSRGRPHESASAPHRRPLGAALASLLLAPAALAAGNDVGRNLGSLLRDYAGQIYGGIVAIVGLVSC